MIRSQNFQDNPAYGCQSSTGKEDSEQSSSSSSSVNSPADSAKTLEIPGSISSSVFSLRGRSPTISEDRVLATPGKNMFVVLRILLEDCFVLVLTTQVCYSYKVKLQTLFKMVGNLSVGFLSVLTFILY